jgi:hypothetical protein
MTIIEIRPFRNGWQAYESAGVQPVFLNQEQFVLPWRTKKGQYAPASSSLGVSRELHLALFPQGQSRPGLASQN